MSTFDLDPKGLLPLLHALAAHFRHVFRSRAWRHHSAQCA